MDLRQWEPGSAQSWEEGLPEKIPSSEMKFLFWGEKNKGRNPGSLFLGEWMRESKALTWAKAMLPDLAASLLALAGRKSQSL